MHSFWCIISCLYAPIILDLKYEIVVDKDFSSVLRKVPDDVFSPKIEEKDQEEQHCDNFELDFHEEQHCVEISHPESVGDIEHPSVKINTIALIMLQPESADHIKQAMSSKEISL